MSVMKDTNKLKVDYLFETCIIDCRGLEMTFASVKPGFHMIVRNSRRPTATHHVSPISRRQMETIIVTIIW